MNRVLDELEKALKRHVRISRVVADKTSRSFLLDVIGVSAGERWSIKMDLPGTFPIGKVSFQLLSGGKPHLEHINHAGTICVSESTGLAVNLDLPTDVGLWWFDSMVSVMDIATQNALRGNFAPLLDEYAGYFQLTEKFVRVPILNELTDNSGHLHGHVDRSGKLVAISSGNHKAYPRYAGHRALYRCEKAPLLHLALETPVLPPKRHSPLGQDLIRSALDAQAPACKARLWRRLEHFGRKRRLRHVLITQPRPSGGREHIGISWRMKKSRAANQLLPGEWRDSLLWGLEPHYPKFHLARTGSDRSLSNRSVVIVGCGAVGGYVAMGLAQAGIGRLKLIDFDELRPENLRRHVLPAEFLGKNKATGLSEWIGSQYPDVDVVADTSPVIESTHIEAADVVCLATGNASLERLVVRQLMADDGSPPVISGWVEALSLGGQAVLTVKGRPGCLECLYTSKDGESLPGSRFGFVAAGEIVDQTLAGCGGAFTPFAGLDANQTASMMTRMVIEILANGSTKRFQLWTGPDDAAVNSNISTSSWYQNLRAGRIPGDLFEHIVNPCCRVCGT